MTDVVIIGAGVGGLAAALDLSSRGLRVRVLEAGDGPGGKAGVTTVDGIEVDTGPSVLTMPEVFDDLFSRHGTRLEEQVTLRRPEPAFRYLYPDGVALDVHHDLDATLESVRRTLGEGPRAELEGFMAYARQIWDVGAPNFVLGDAPSLTSVLRMGLASLSAIRKIDSMRSMQRAIRDRVKSPHLRDLLARYATYNGSDVHRAPATLNCIAWVELGLGGYGIEGGIFALIRRMVAVAEAAGVSFEYGTPVRGVDVRSGRVRGVETDRGHVPATSVVANADAAHVARDLLPDSSKLSVKGPPSMSGWTAVLKARRPAEPRAAHTVVFPEVYAEEFRDIFDRDRPPESPTVYACAQEACHGRAGWTDAEPLFVMANAPAEPAGECRPETTWTDLRDRVLARLRGFDLIEASDPVLWERTPPGLAARFPGSRGAIYGAASNSPFAAFARPSNRVVGVAGLYLASGSAHPGGGLPLCALSGRAAASHVIRDSGRAHRPEERSA